MDQHKTILVSWFIIFKNYEKSSKISIFGLIDKRANEGIITDMKIFISGANGALGLEMQSLLRQENIKFLATDINQLDITDFRKTKEALFNYRPEVICHFAAISDVDFCEKNPGLAHRTNALSTLGLAIIAKELGAKLVYISTNFVFDGKSEKPYIEYSPTSPINEYGRTKLLGEGYVKDISDRFFIVRTSWLFGKSAKTFLSKFLAADNKPNSIDVICDQFASFTYVVDLAGALLSLMRSENYGIFHIVNNGVGSWLDFALEAKELLKFKTEIKAVKTEELGLAAPRPRFTPLESRHYEFLFNRSMCNWQEALTHFVKSISKKKSA